MDEKIKKRNFIFNEDAELKRLQQRTPAEILADEARAESKRHLQKRTVKKERETTKWALKDKFWIAVYLVLIGGLFLAPEILSKHHYIRQIDLCRFYFGKSAAFIDFMMSWGWILLGLPIPIVLPTTYFNTVFCVKLYGSIVMFVLSFYKKRGPILVGVVLILVAVGSLEYERRTLSDFETREELITFLYNDRTDSMEYTGGFNCEDFSRVLIQGAKGAGYRLYFHATEGHALCEAYIITESLWVVVEPQTDGVEW